MKISGGSPQVKKCEECSSVLSTEAVLEFKGEDEYQFFNLWSGSRNYGFHVAKNSQTGEIEVYFASGVTLSKCGSGIDIVLEEGK